MSLNSSCSLEDNEFKNGIKKKKLRAVTRSLRSLLKRPLLPLLQPKLGMCTP